MILLLFISLAAIIAGFLFRHLPLVFIGFAGILLVAFIEDDIKTHKPSGISQSIAVTNK